MIVRTLIALLFTLNICINGFAQESDEPYQADTLVNGDLDHGFVFALDDKMSTVDGDFANFLGIHTGWLIDHKLLLGVAGYGTTNSPTLDMGYGGFFAEYFFDSTKLFNYSVRGLIGAGGADTYNGRHHGRHDVEGLFVAEPEARVTLNVMKPFRIGFGVGYRFVGGDSTDSGLSGPTFSVSFKFGKF